ncbi:MAG: stage 0 sporulation family protein [Defluviitaleaceae bacterium]|nr:stage 0 sporulation family protein [Defluviitaleaceae bacterium]
MSEIAENTKTVEIIGVSFRRAGTAYYFDPGKVAVERDMKVIVETARGVECGTVKLANRFVPESAIVAPLKKIIRIATDEDLSQIEKNREREAEAIPVFAEAVKRHNLDMKLVDIELTFDQSKIFFYFSADGRVDFRELVKELVSIFRMRIELRQIGPRDETKILGGVGVCGRGLCCATFLTEFGSVSVKMAKDQNLSLNPVKISGVCGRLMCCLKYEEETYEELNKNLPNIGDTVKTPDGNGEVMNVMILRQLVKVAVRKKPQDEPSIATYPINNITLITKNAKQNDSK